MKLYHGSKNLSFTVFNPKMSDDGISLFLTDDRKMASSYSEYGGIVNPYTNNIIYPYNKSPIAEVSTLK